MEQMIKKNKESKMKDRIKQANICEDLKKKLEINMHT